MKKYKHKQTGLIAQQLTVNYKVGECEVPGCIIEKCQDWEEVIEKNYEIVREITKYDPKNDYKVAGSRIVSVKRLSDGEVFTVGDRVMTQGSRGSNITPPIRQFRLRHRCIGKDSTGTYLYGDLDRIWIVWEAGCGGNWLESTVKLKQPIFLTHDGEDIFDGDKVWYVNKQDHYKSYFIASKNQSFFSDRMAYFLTRQDAEDYIEKNKVLFTTEDGVDLKHGDNYYFVDTDFSIHTMKAHSGAGQYSERKYFSTVEEAHEYVMQNVKALSIRDFWEITCMSTSNFNKSTYMKDLVKQTLGLK